LYVKTGMKDEVAWICIESIRRQTNVAVDSSHPCQGGYILD